MPDHKRNILFIRRGPEYYPYLPHFKDRYILLSAHFKGSVFIIVSDPEFKEGTYGDFRLFGFQPKTFNLWNKFRYYGFIFKNAMRLNKECPVDCIVCSDPIFTGVIGAILKYYLKTQLIVEINSENYAGAPGAFYGNSFIIKIKAIILKFFAQCSLGASDSIKILTETMKDAIPKRFQKKQIFAFHDFVPTHAFSTEKTALEKSILFVGYPFYLKGVDVLIKAFHKICEKFPNFRLILVGHEIEKIARTEFPQLSLNIQFYPGMPNNALKDFFLNCYCFVLASKTEGLPRVIIEAMASGKPVIGTRVGGIPALINDGENGFLIEPNDVNQLAARLDILLSNQDLARTMGEEGKRIVEENFSSSKYTEFFHAMINTITGHTQ